MVLVPRPRDAGGEGGGCARLEERGTREGSQEKPPPFAFRGCLALETGRPGHAGEMRLGWWLHPLSPPLCFCVPSPVCRGGGREAVKVGVRGC